MSRRLIWQIREGKRTASVIWRQGRFIQSDGRAIDWRHEVTMRLINLQQKDGSWSNANGRWWEKDPNLVTAYAVLSLEIIWHGM